MNNKVRNKIHPLQLIMAILLMLSLVMTAYAKKIDDEFLLGSSDIITTFDVLDGDLENGGESDIVTDIAEQASPEYDDDTEEEDYESLLDDDVITVVDVPDAETENGGEPDEIIGEDEQVLPEYVDDTEEKDYEFLLNTVDVITAFEVLDEDVEEQTVAAGTPLAVLNLPDTLATEIDGEPDSITGVDWQASPKYNGDIEGTYIFTPVIPALYIVDAKPPVIMVTVVLTDINMKSVNGTADIVITIAEDKYGSTALYLMEGIATTENNLQEGVSAADENGNPVPVTVQSVGGLDLDHPARPDGSVFPPQAYTITYAAVHPVTEDVFTETRNVYVTVAAIVPLSNATDLVTEIATYGLLASVDSGNPNIVEVTGNSTSAASITLNIDSGVTVKWGAAYSSSGNSILINLPGDGEFEVITGGSISVSSGTAIEATGASAAVTVSGGAVSSAAGNAIRTTGMSSTVTVSGGFVETRSAEAAIHAAGNVDITGGTVCATTGYAVKNINGSGTVTVSGGFVFAGGNDISDVISQAGIPFSNPDSDGIVVAWDTLTGSGTYSEGTATDLRVFPANTATWHNNAGLGGGINYTNGSNSGFFRLNSATVIAYVPVTDITGVPAAATAGTPLSLMGTVTPANATNQTITWSIQNAGATGPAISGSTLNTTAAGTVTVRAIITDGKAVGVDYTQDFDIMVNAGTAPLAVASVMPSGTGAARSGNIVITFSETIGTTGTVSLNDGVTILTGGSWNAANTVYTIPYSGLSYSTVYIITIDGFKDIAGNVMTMDNSHGFTTISGSSSSAGTSEKSSYTAGIDGSWQLIDQVNYKWVFTRNDGTRIFGNWAQISDTSNGSAKTCWYHFGNDGIMDSGWFRDADGKWYYLSETHDGWFGHMVTGWQEIDSKWYYFADSDIYTEKTEHLVGSMYVEERTPDNFIVDEDGAWKQ